MTGSRPGRRPRWRALALLVLLAGCAGTPKAPPPAQLARPTWTVGDRWVFRRTPMLTAGGPSLVVTHEVAEAGADGYTMRMSWLGQEITRYWTPDLHLREQTVGPRLLNRFDPPAMFFVWPLALGKTWEQEFDYRDGRQDGRYVNSWRVGPRVEAVSVMAGAFVALRIERLGREAQALETYWYAPAARYWVRFEDHLGRYTDELVEFGSTRS